MKSLASLACRSMPSDIRGLRRHWVVSILLFGWALTGCGQKGPLRLPPAAPAASAPAEVTSAQPSPKLPFN